MADARSGTIDCHHAAPRSAHLLRPRPRTSSGSHRYRHPRTPPRLHGRRDPVTLELELRLHFVLRHIEAFPLGTPYFEVVRRIRNLIHGADPLKTLVVDASGVGAPIVEAFRAARLGCGLIPITITATGHPHPDPHGGYLVPRRDLISNLRMLMERGLLKIPPAIHAKEALIEELIHLQDHQGCHHDDLAISLTLAAWQSTRGIVRLMDG